MRRILFLLAVVLMSWAPCCGQHTAPFTYGEFGIDLIANNEDMDRFWTGGSLERLNAQGGGVGIRVWMEPGDNHAILLNPGNNVGLLVHPLTSPAQFRIHTHADSWNNIAFCKGFSSSSRYAGNTALQIDKPAQNDAKVSIDGFIKSGNNGHLRVRTALGDPQFNPDITQGMLVKFSVVNGAGQVVSYWGTTPVGNNKTTVFSTTLINFENLPQGGGAPGIFLSLPAEIVAGAPQFHSKWVFELINIGGNVVHWQECRIPVNIQNVTTPPLNQDKMPYRQRVKVQKIIKANRAR